MKNKAAQSLGRRGGQTKTDAKAAAARANGAKGGRPVTRLRLRRIEPGTYAIHGTPWLIHRFGGIGWLAVDAADRCNGPALTNTPHQLLRDAKKEAFGVLAQQRTKRGSEPPGARQLDSV